MKQKVTQQQYDDAVKNLKELRAFVDSIEVEQPDFKYFPTEAPEIGFFAISFNGIINSRNYGNSESMMDGGHYYATREAAEQADKERIALVKVIRRKQELEFELGADGLDWENDVVQKKWRPDFNHNTGDIVINCNSALQEKHPMWYTTNMKVWEQVIEEMPEDIKTAFGVEI